MQHSELPIKKKKVFVDSRSPKKMVEFTRIKPGQSLLANGFTIYHHGTGMMVDRSSLEAINLAVLDWDLRNTAEMPKRSVLKHHPRFGLWLIGGGDRQRNPATSEMPTVGDAGLLDELGLETLEENERPQVHLPAGNPCSGGFRERKLPPTNRAQLWLINGGLS